MARRKMLPGKISLWGKAVHVDWAEPDQPDVVNRNFGAKSATQHLPGGRYFNDFGKSAAQQPIFDFPKFNQFNVVWLPGLNCVY